MKATSFVEGQLFERPDFLSTSKEAEQAAANVALMSLSLDNSHKDDSGVYKNLLIELARREGFCKLTYKTIRSGTVQMPTFFSIVEVEGKQFHGEPMKSKKQAEQDAAKVAYLSLKDLSYFDTILEIKEKIEKYQRIPVSMQTLIFDGQTLPDDADIDKCVLLDKSHVQLRMPPISSRTGL
ncbi:hypothetical protein K1719_005329 [Acacia pycnantha]|nr:hypothetical protein K1719_005329 [Acacia pycnantha]